MVHLMKLKLIREGLLVKLANHYTIRGALDSTEQLSNKFDFPLKRVRWKTYQWF